MRLASRMDNLPPSPTLAVNAKAAEMRAQGLDVISFAAGEPDFDTPEHIKEAAIQALRDGQTKYTEVRGLLALREAVCDWVEANTVVVRLNDVGGNSQNRKNARKQKETGYSHDRFLQGGM